jgi:tetratricopeptide (TPR) repeat protein
VRRFIPYLFAATLWGQTPPADIALLRPLFEQALAARELALGAEHPKVARSSSDLGMFLKAIGDPDGAESALRRALEIDRKALGDANSLVAADRENLAGILEQRSHIEEAIELYRGAAEGPDPAIQARCLGRLAAFEEARNALDAAEALYRRALAAETAAYGKDSARVAVRLNDLALLLEAKDDFRSAEPLLRRALANQEKAFGPDHPEVAMGLNNLASSLLALGRIAAAEPAQRRALRILEARLNPENPRIATACGNLADILGAKGDRAGAARFYRRAIEITVAAYGPQHQDVALYRDKIASLRPAQRP